MEWIATAIAVIAAVAAVWQAFEARKARTGADASSRSAAADAKRMADAMEEQTRLARAAADVYTDPWIFVHENPSSSSHRWKFTLTGNELASDVRWEVDPTDKHFAATTDLPSAMEPGETVVFSWLRTFGSPRTLKLTVTWLRPGETERRRSVTTLTP
jgi:hypothetical protein